MLACYSNSFALQAMNETKKEMNGGAILGFEKIAFKTTYGLAIYPASTLLNHSCNPNTTVVEEEGSQVMFKIILKI